MLRTMSSIAAVGLALAALPTAAQDYPRIANLWGIGPQARDYDKWARYDLLVMSGGSADQWRRFRQGARERNPDIMVLGTAPLMNVGPPEATPWMKDDWFVRRPNGEKVNWWASQIYAPNLFIDECLEALIEQTAKPYGELLSAGVVDGVFYDSVVGGVTWLGDVDTDRDGVADRPQDVNPEWQQRQCLFFDRLRERWPEMLILANDVDKGHAPHLHGRLFEGGPLLDRVASGALGAKNAIDALNGWMADTLQPGITFPIMTHPLGWQGWRVGKGNKVTTRGELDRVRRDFRRMRLGLLTTLMTDAYYAYDFGTVWYGSPLWYAEYDAPLGKPLGPGTEVFEVPPVPVLEWAAGQDAGAFALDGDSKATERGIEGDIDDPNAPWARLFATDPEKLPLQPGKTYRIEADLEVLRTPSGTFQFNVRTGKGGWERHDKGIAHHAGEPGSTWRISADVTLDDFDDYAAEWHALGGGGLRLVRLGVQLIGESYFRREFEGGMALLNPLPKPITIDLRRPMRRLADDEAPRHVIEVDDESEGFASEGAWERRSGETHYCGQGYRLARKPGSTARWGFIAPGTETYTVFAAFPGGKELTDAATYALSSADGDLAVTLDQRKGDGGWVNLFEARLSEGRHYEVVLRSGGTGLTAADGIRVESAARFNDGSVAERVVLGPLDGTILLNE